MPARITPGTVKVVTQDGEVHVCITLELNINLNADGLAGLGVSDGETKIKKLDKPKEDDSTIWEIPDFGSSKIDFGKRE